MRSGPTSGFTGRSAGSSLSRSEPSKSLRRVEVITLSSSESEEEDLEIIAARLRQLAPRKTGRKYTETNRKHVHSNRCRTQEEESSKQEIMCVRPRVAFTKLGYIRAMQKH